MEALLSTFNDGNVPTDPQYLGLYTMRLNCPLKIVSADNFVTRRGACMRVYVKDKEGVQWFCFVQDDAGVFKTEESLMLFKCLHDSGTAMFMVPYEVNGGKKRSMFFVPYGM